VLEHEVNQLDNELRRSEDLDVRQSLRRWETLVEHGKDSTRTESKLIQKLSEAKTVLREYCTFD
jgi:hypothetical protein